jgi:tripartite-type tricarboxylate transporter receptor subunit TctC
LLGSRVLSGLAQGWSPSQPVKMIVAFPPGGSNDLVARILGPALAKAAGQPVVIDNKAGAGGAIGAREAARAAPDGHTLFLAGISLVIQPSLLKDAGYDARNDFTPVIELVEAPLVLLVNRSVPVETFPEFLEYARKKGADLFYGSAGVASAQNLVGELFNKMAGTKMKHVPFRGNGPATTALLAGDIQVFFDIVPSALSFAASGKLRALAVTGKTPNPSLPNLPTIQASGVPGFEFTLWQAILLPKGTPAPVVQQWVTAAREALSDPQVQRQMTGQGFQVVVDSSPQQLAELIQREFARWAKVIADAGIKGES